MFKNLKISMKLSVSFGTVLLLLMFSVVIAILNMGKISEQVEMYSGAIVPNSNHVWSMRRDLVSVQRYMLIALQDQDSNEIIANLDLADKESKRIMDTIVKFKTSARANQDSIEELEKLFSQMEPLRAEISSLLKKNDVALNEQAYTIFLKSYKPIIDKCGVIMDKIGEVHSKSAEDQATVATNVKSLAYTTLFITGIISIIITLLMITIIRKAVLIPVTEIEKATEELAGGNLNAHIKYESKDELGQLSTNMRNLVNIFQEIISDLTFQLGKFSDGDFTVGKEKKEIYIGDFIPISNAIDLISDRLSDTLSQINDSADQVASGSDQVSSGAQALSQGATQQASSVEELSATIAEISNQINENSQNSQLAKDQSTIVGNEMTNSNKKMQDMISAMENINDKSTKISKIIKTIEDIAFQTNILALNASIEAARAGAAGRGFAVVADEVGSLAGKSAEAAKSTTSLIEETVKAVNVGTQIADDTANALVAVVEGAEKVTKFIRDIAGASSEQASAIAQITMGIEQISAVVQTNSATSQESAAASEELSGQSQMLKDLIRTFKLKKKHRDAPSKNSVDEIRETNHVYQINNYENKY